MNLLVSSLRKKLPTILAHSVSILTENNYNRKFKNNKQYWAKETK